MEQITSLFNHQFSFWIMLISAILVAKTPLRTPFQWMETFFHELSHGLAAIFTIGWIHSIKLHWDGSGVCYTRGGLRIIILLAGYIGAALWGGFIYLAGWTLDTTGDTQMLYFLIGLLTIVTVLWVRNPTTLLIMATMAIIFYIPTQLLEYSLPAYAIEFFGLYVVQSAITAPLHLIDGKHKGDGAALADITLIFPEGVWILLWFTTASLTLLYLWVWTTGITIASLNWLPYLNLSLIAN